MTKPRSRPQKYILGLLLFSVIPSVVHFPTGTLHQFKSDGATPVIQGGTTQEGNIVLGISFRSVVVTPLKLQVELRPADKAFTGIPTAASGVILLVKSGSLNISGLAAGNYHWQARLIDTITGATSAWQGFGGDERSDISIAPREPVVIVPGISGSILQSIADATEVWPNIAKMLTSPSDDYLDALILDDPVGVQPQSTIRAASVLKTVNFTFGGVNVFKNDFYGNIIAAFVREGYQENKDLYTVPYDWRLDVGRSFSALAAVMSRALAASPTGKISVVAHSMGGLLLKRYLASVPDAVFLDKIIMVGVPHFGAPYALKILDYGDDLGIPIANRNEIRKIAGNMPAIYELLPSSRYVALAGAYVQDFRTGGGGALDHAATTNFLADTSGAGGRNISLLELADDFHSLVDAVPIAAPNIYSIIGCGKPTITGFEIYDGGEMDMEWGSGDGTVPTASALGTTAITHDYFVQSGKMGIDHVGLISDPRPVSLVLNIVNGVTASLPQGISSAASDCEPDTAGVATNETTPEFGVL